jgi:hypothetical protein
MAQVTNGIVAGWAFGQIWKAKTCYAYGQVADVDAVSTPTTSAAYLMRYPKTTGLTPIARNSITITGGDTIVGKVQFGPSELPDFTFEAASMDADLNALISKSLVDQTTNADWSMFGNNESLSVAPNMGLSLHSQLQVFGSDCDGETKWLNTIFPSVKIASSIPPFAFQAEAPTPYSVTPNFANKQPNGDAFDANIQFADNKAVYYYIISDYPIGIVTWFADGVDTTFNTVYKPISTTITVNDTPNHFAVNGTPTALTSIVVATGLATATAAGSDGDINVLMHETEFVAV